MSLNIDNKVKIHLKMAVINFKEDWVAKIKKEEGKNTLATLMVAILKKNCMMGNVFPIKKWMNIYM